MKYKHPLKNILRENENLWNVESTRRARLHDGNVSDGPRSLTFRTKE